MAFFTAKIIEKCPNSKRLFIWFGGAVLVLPLLLFKYYHFINESLYEILSLLGLRFQLPGLNWAIPIGMSFFTLQALSYIGDVYYKTIKAESDFASFALYLSFFPSILSGPVNRAEKMLPQIKAKRPYFDYTKAVEGFRLILWGMFMKVVVADGCGIYVDLVYGNYESYSGFTCLVTSFLYTIQIYADLGGYSFISIGVGKMLGFEMMNNFRRPFFAHSVSDYWNRWHLSVSTWLKDYVYIPLGGSRRGTIKTYRNIIVTFLVSGIWHGANWTYVIWGLLHSLVIIIERLTNQQKCHYKMVGRIIKILVTFIVINILFVVFRMPSIHDANMYLLRMFDLRNVFEYTAPSLSVLFFALLLVVKEAGEEFFLNKRISFFNSTNLIVRWSSYIVVSVVILLEGVLNSDSFIYANF